MTLDSISSNSARGRLRGEMRAILGAEGGATERDRAFLSICHECERYYIELDRGLQIRVEKWIEKLSLTGFNSVWKKHRNAYAKLLLHMILNKRFQEPFHKMPPEGQLPSFPIHLRTYTVRGAYGFDDRTHGKPFWRDIYQKVHKSPITLDLNEEQKKMMTTFEDSIEDLRDSNNQILEIRRLDMIVRDHQRKLELAKEELEDEKQKREDLVEQGLKEEKKKLEEEKKKLEVEKRRTEEARIEAEKEETERLRRIKEEEAYRKEEEERTGAEAALEERRKEEEKARSRKAKNTKKGNKNAAKGRSRKDNDSDDEDGDVNSECESEDESASISASGSELPNKAVASLAAAIQEQQDKILRGEDVAAAVRAHKALSDALASLVTGADDSLSSSFAEAAAEGERGDALKAQSEGRGDKASSPIGILSAPESSEKKKKEKEKDCVCTVEVGTSTLTDEQEGRTGPYSRGRVSHSWKFLFDLSVAPSMADAMNKYEAADSGPGDRAWPFHAAGYYEDTSLFTEQEHAASGGGRVGVLEGDYPAMDQPRDTQDFMLRLNHKLFSAAEQASTARGHTSAPLVVPSTAHPRLTSRPTHYQQESTAPTASAHPSRPPTPAGTARPRARAAAPTVIDKMAPTGRGTHVVPVPEPRDARGNVYEYLQRHLELDHWEYRYDTPAGTYQPRD